MNWIETDEVIERLMALPDGRLRVYLVGGRFYDVYRFPDDPTDPPAPH